MSGPFLRVKRDRCENINTVLLFKYLTVGGMTARQLVTTSYSATVEIIFAISACRDERKLQDLDIGNRLYLCSYFFNAAS